MKSVQPQGHSTLGIMNLLHGDARRDNKKESISAFHSICLLVLQKQQILIKMSYLTKIKIIKGMWIFNKIYLSTNIAGGSEIVTLGYSA